MSSFFPPPLKLQDYPSCTPRDSASPSPTKKRRVDSLPPASAASSSSPAKNNYNAPSRPPLSARASTAAVPAPADDDALLTSRLHSTLRLRDAWSDIWRRHSLPPALPSSASSSSSPFPPSSSSRRKHRPTGRTRAIPVEEDDIIDLRTMELVVDRGVLRNSRAGAFAIGGYAGRENDVVVARDTGRARLDERDGSGAEGNGDGSGSDGYEDPEEGEVDWEEPEEGNSSSEDELATMDDLPSLPSLLFREQRRKDAERRRELRDFWTQERQQSRRFSEGGTGTPEDGEAWEEGELAGNERLERPVAPPSSSWGRASIAAPDYGDEGGGEGDEEDELSFFAPDPAHAPMKSISPELGLGRSTSSPPNGLTQPRARPLPSPSSASSLRHGIDAFQIASSSPTKYPTPTSTSWTASASAANSIFRAPVQPAPKASSSKPRSSSSPLRQSYLAPSPSPSPSPPPSSSDPLACSETARRSAPRPTQPPPQPPMQAYQRPTPTPTPTPPPPTASSSAELRSQSKRSSESSRSQQQLPAPSISSKRPHRPHSFELVIDVSPSASSTSRKNIKGKLPTSKSMRSLALRGQDDYSEDDKAVQQEQEEEEEKPLETGLTTPPVSRSRLSPRETGNSREGPFELSPSSAHSLSTIATPTASSDQVHSRPRRQPAPVGPTAGPSRHCRSSSSSAAVAPASAPRPGPVPLSRPRANPIVAFPSHRLRNPPAEEEGDGADDDDPLLLSSSPLKSSLLDRHLGNGSGRRRSGMAGIARPRESAGPGSSASPLRRLEQEKKEREQAGDEGEELGRTRRGIGVDFLREDSDGEQGRGAGRPEKEQEQGEADTAEESDDELRLR
ncbi:hypothetical protein JCM1841_001884 [Sporobolomyces salmonicolor]